MQKKRDEEGGGKIESEMDGKDTFFLFKQEKIFLLAFPPVADQEEKVFF